MKLPNFLQILEWKLFFRAFKRFLYASRISVFICLIVVILLTLSFQSIEIIVGFMQNPINLALFWPIFILLAIVISHYPSYLDMKNKMDFSKNSGSTPKVKWKMNTPLLLRWLPDTIEPWIGIISYEKNNDVINGEIINGDSIDQNIKSGEFINGQIKNCNIKDGKIISGQIVNSEIFIKEKKDGSEIYEDSSDGFDHC